MLSRVWKVLAGACNANSISGNETSHIEMIRQFIHDNPSYHVFEFTEARLDPKVADHVMNVNGFFIIRQDRNLKGGGVALYVWSKFKVDVLAKSDTLGPLNCSVQHGNFAPVTLALTMRRVKDNKIHRFQYHWLS